MNDQRIHHNHSGTWQRHLDADMETDIGCLSMDPVGWGGWYCMPWLRTGKRTMHQPTLRNDAYYLCII